MHKDPIHPVDTSRSTKMVSWWSISIILAVKSVSTLLIPPNTNPRFPPRNGFYYCQQRTWFKHAPPPQGESRRIFYKLADATIDQVIERTHGTVNPNTGGDFYGFADVTFLDGVVRALMVRYQFTPATEPGWLDLTVTSIITAVIYISSKLGQPETD